MSVLKQSDYQGTYQEILGHLQKSWEKRSGRPAAETAKALISLNRARDEVRLIERYVPDVRDKKLLEIGSGYGTFLAVARREFGINAYGIEPSASGIYKTTYRMALGVLGRSGISGKYLRRGMGENIPFSDSSFDVVFSYHVLEHVTRYREIFRETVRVLKPGGILIFVCPNYGSFWESHYGLPWLPYLPKFLGKVYVQLRRRDPTILDELSLVTQPYLEKVLHEIGEIKVVGWGADYFDEEILSGAGPKESTANSAENGLKFIQRLGFLPLLRFAGKNLKMQTPIVLVARKEKTNQTD